MIRKIGKTALIAGALLCFAPGAFAACPGSAPSLTTACMNLTGAGNNTMGGFYVGPYSAFINGSLTPTNVICDDFFDDSFLPETWTADVISGSSGAFGSTRNAGRQSPPLTGDALIHAYNEIGYLATRLLSATGAEQGEIHFALWNVFDPGTINLLVDPTFRSAAQGFYDDAVNNYSSNSTYISQFTIYSPNTAAGNLVDCPNNPGACGATHPPQEFLVKTPEPPVLALLGVDLSGVGLLFFVLRRRRSARL